MSLLCWNCRGAGKPATVRELRDLTRQLAPSIVCIVETQIEGSRVENMVGSLGYEKSFAVSSSGRSGELGIFWNEEINLEVIGYYEYHIDVLVEELVHILTRITFIYGEAQVSERYKTWDLLRGITGANNQPWVVMGDFNKVLLPSEHDGVGTRSQAQMDSFRDALDTCGLTDIGFSGRNWTFEKKVAGGTYTRVHLDRCVANVAWCMAFPNSILEHKEVASSDHVPIFLDMGGMHACRRDPCSFKYKICWERDPALTDVVQAAWVRGPTESVAGMHDKLQGLATDLAQWDRRHFGNVRAQIKQLQNLLQELRGSPGRSGPTSAEIKVTDQLVELYHREEILWRQRARIEWLKHGDKNTYFFHLRASRRRRKNKIKALQRADGQATENAEEMEAMTTVFYKKLYTSEGVQDMDQVLEMVPRKVTDEMNATLNAPYDIKEVKTALFQMFPTKAPGPDGFPAHFFQRHWETCGEEITRMVLRIIDGTESAECINETILVLIPKVKNPTLLTQFLPISLCNIFYKIASKVISNRLKLVLPDIISEKQSAFVPGRMITDNIIIAYECLHFMKRNKAKKHQSCALKLDMMKAYDRVEWPYLKAIMLKLGFSESWVNIVMNLVSIVNFSVLFNGKRLEGFKPTRGIRQGDPISPYLFLLAAEGLSCLLKSRRQSSNMEGLQVSSSAPKVNHLLFADDSLLFLKANSEGAEEVNQVLDIYCRASGQRVNHAKSTIFFSKGVPDSVRNVIMLALNVPNETLNEKYLGMPSDLGTVRMERSNI